MTIKSKLRALSGIQIMVALLLFWLFFLWAPWTSCKSITTEMQKQRISPPGAKSYYVNHGETVYLSHGTKEEEPFQFTCLTFTLFGCVIFLILSGRYAGKIKICEGLLHQEKSIWFKGKKPLANGKLAG